LIGRLPATVPEPSAEQEVTTVESYLTLTTCPSGLPVVTHDSATGTWLPTGAPVTRVTAPLAAAVDGTGMPISMRYRTATAKTNAQLPISDVVVFDGFAGIRSWSPPV
jgi:hypothetical protein